MKVYSAFIALALMAISFGCGGDGGTATSAEDSSEDRPVAKSTQAQEEPDYPVPKIPSKRGPLKKLVVKDVEVGMGPVARWGDEVAVRYVGLYYQTGEPYSQHWGFTLEFKLNGKAYGTGWQKAIQGMRVGGRREALIPGRQFFEGEDMAYVITLVWVKPG
jgi:FKBP-type peptidyl-prolyl cis-trans isomerase